MLMSYVYRRTLAVVLKLCTKWALLVGNVCSITKTCLKYSLFIVKAVLEKDKEKVVKESVTLKASVTTLTAKVETLNKNIAQQKETEKELQVQ